MNEKFELDYTLSDKELYMGLRAAKAVPAMGAAQIIRTVLLALVIVVCGYNMIIDPKYMQMGLILIPLSLILIALVWIIPAKAFKEAAKSAADSRHVSLTMYPGLLHIEPGTDIPLNGTSTIKNCTKHRTVLIYPVGEKDLVYMIPYRVVDLKDFEAFINMLYTEVHYDGETITVRRPIDEDEQ